MTHSLTGSNLVLVLKDTGREKVNGLLGLPNQAKKILAFG
jgi:hypothetical protein